MKYNIVVNCQKKVKVNKLFYFFLLVLLTACSSDDNNNNCNFLPNVRFSLEVDTNLPQFSELAFNNNGVYVNRNVQSGGIGINGVWLWRLSSSTLLAWEATDPNLPPSSCSLLIRSNDSREVAESTCDNANRFSLSTGLPLDGNSGICTLKPYRVQDIGNGVFRVSN